MKELVQKFLPLFKYIVERNIKYGIRKGTIEECLPTFNIKQVMMELRHGNAIREYGNVWALTDTMQTYLRVHKNDIIPQELNLGASSPSALIDVYKPLFDHFKATKQKLISKKSAYAILNNADVIIETDVMMELVLVGLLQQSGTQWELTTMAKGLIGLEGKVKTLSQHVADGTVDAIKDRSFKPATFNAKEILDEADALINADKKLTKKQKSKSDKMSTRFNSTASNTASNNKAANIIIEPEAQAWFDANMSSDFIKFAKKHVHGPITDKAVLSGTRNDFIGNGRFASILSDYQRQQKGSK